MLRKPWCWWCLVVLVLAMPTLASADTGNRVAVVGRPTDDPVTRQLVVELEALAFDVVVDPEPRAERSWEALDQTARELDVAAAIWVVPVDEPTADLVVVDRVTGKAVQRRIEVDASLPATVRTRVLVSRAIELLRASLRELDEPEAEPLGEVEPAPATKRLASPPPAELRIAVGPALVVSPGGVPLQPALRLGGWRRLGDHTGLELRALPTLRPVEVRGTEGSARVLPASLDLVLWYSPLEPRRDFQFSLGASAGAVLVHMDGAASEGYASSSDDVVVGLGTLDVALTQRITTTLHLGLEAMVGVTTPEVRVMFVDRAAAAWGRPVAAFSLTAGMDIR